jgi:hypothetical protein
MGGLYLALNSRKVGRDWGRATIPTLRAPNCAAALFRRGISPRLGRSLDPTKRGVFLIFDTNVRACRRRAAVGPVKAALASAEPR